jgi:hypothetical protein
MGRPLVQSCLLGLGLVVAGLAVRFWAMGYIGAEARTREVGVDTRISAGPFSLFRHPLYLGNSLLVCGMLVALHPSRVVGLAVFVLFAIEYTFIIVAEERAMISANAKRQTPNAESRAPHPGPLPAGGAREEGGSRVPSDECRPGQTFLLRRVRAEWPTWVVTGLAFGLALARALVRR